MKYTGIQMNCKKHLVKTLGRRTALAILLSVQTSFGFPPHLDINDFFASHLGACSPAYNATPANFQDHDLSSTTLLPPFDVDHPQYKQVVEEACQYPTAILEGYDPMPWTAYHNPYKTAQRSHPGDVHLPPMQAVAKDSALSVYPTLLHHQSLPYEATIAVAVAYADFSQKQRHAFDDDRFLLNLDQECNRILYILESAPPALWKALIDEKRSKGSPLYTVRNENREKYNYQRSRANTFYTRIYNALGLSKELAK